MKVNLNLDEPDSSYDSTVSLCAFVNEYSSLFMTSYPVHDL